MTEAKEKMKRLISDIWKIVSKKLLSMEIKDTGIITITEKVQVITVNDWLKFSDDELSDYLNRELEYTDRGQLKSNTTNLITVLVNPLFCKEEKVIDGTIFFDTCSMTVRFFGMLKGEKQKGKEIRKWNDHLTNLLGVEIEREFGIKYSKNRMDDAITFIAHKRAVNLPAMYMKSLPYDGERHILIFSVSVKLNEPELFNTNFNASYIFSSILFDEFGLFLTSATVFPADIEISVEPNAGTGYPKL